LCYIYIIKARTAVQWLCTLLCYIYIIKARTAVQWDQKGEVKVHESTLT